MVDVVASAISLAKEIYGVGKWFYDQVENYKEVKNDLKSIAVQLNSLSYIIKYNYSDIDSENRIYINASLFLNEAKKQKKNMLLRRKSKHIFDKFKSFFKANGWIQDIQELSNKLMDFLKFIDSFNVSKTNKLNENILSINNQILGVNNEILSVNNDILEQLKLLYGQGSDTNILKILNKNLSVIIPNSRARLWWIKYVIINPRNELEKSIKKSDLKIIIKMALEDNLIDDLQNKLTIISSDKENKEKEDLKLNNENQKHLYKIKSNVHEEDLQNDEKNISMALSHIDKIIEQLLELADKDKNDIISIWEYGSFTAVCDIMSFIMLELEKENFLHTSDKNFPEVNTEEIFKDIEKKCEEFKEKINLTPKQKQQIKEVETKEKEIEKICEKIKNINLEIYKLDNKQQTPETKIQKNKLNQEKNKLNQEINKLNQEVNKLNQQIDELDRKTNDLIYCKLYTKTMVYKTNEIKNGKTLYSFTVSVGGDNVKDVDYVDFNLHPTFKNNQIRKYKNFEYEAKAWGMFNIRIDIYMKNGEIKKVDHYLEFPLINEKEKIVIKDLYDRKDEKNKKVVIGLSKISNEGKNSKKQISKIIHAKKNPERKDNNRPSKTEKSSKYCKNFYSGMAQQKSEAR